MRIRTIKPEFWRHEDLSALPESTLLIAVALLNYADDEGYFNANPKLIQAECCPLREPSVSIQESLSRLSEIHWLRLGTGPDGKRYGHVVTFAEHQRINRPTPSKISKLDIVWDGSATAHTQLSEPSSPEGNREQGTGNREQEGARAPLPVQEAFDAYNDRARQLSLPIANKLTEDRRKHLRCRLSEHGWEGWERALAELDAPFLRGTNDRGWKADLDFMLQPKSFNRLIEGGYRGRGGNGRAPPQRGRSVMDIALEGVKEAMRESDAEHSDSASSGDAGERRRTG